MVKFILVENDKGSQAHLADIIKTSSFKKENIKIECFTKFSQELKNVIKDTTCPKIYIMDIELDGKISGIDIAKYIRENDWDSEIIFITSHDKMFEVAYRSVYEIFDFIEKFYHMDTRLQKDLEVIYRKNYDNKMFKYSNNNVSLQLFYRSIKYLYKDKESRKVVVVADNVTYTICLNLNEALNMLDDRFKMVHRCCIVNTNRVIEYNWSKGYFVLDTLESVNFLSRKYKGTICK